MPEICRFYGIVIKLYFADHEPPHFHAEYAEHEARIAIQSLAVLSGALPPRAMGRRCQLRQRPCQTDHRTHERVTPCCRGGRVNITCVLSPWRARASVKEGRRPLGHSYLHVETPATLPTWTDTRLEWASVTLRYAVRSIAIVSDLGILPYLRKRLPSGNGLAVVQKSGLWRMLTDQCDSGVTGLSPDTACHRRRAA